MPKMVILLTIKLVRFATNWGEATFIPVGANGLVTNAFDLSKLRGPGASIRRSVNANGTNYSKFTS